MPTFADCGKCGAPGTTLRIFRETHVVMLEHVHLLVSEPDRSTLVKALQAIFFFLVRKGPDYPAQAEIG